MGVYERDSATGYKEIDRWNDGVGWIAHPNETGERASHALKGDNGVWLIDPVDAPGVDELVAEFGSVAGVAVLSSHHARDAGTIANRHGVKVHIPRWMDRVEAHVEASVEREGDLLSNSGFDITRVNPLSIYRGAIAYRERDGTLIIPDLLSSGSGYPVEDERMGVLLALRLTPPKDVFRGMEPQRILFGHGEGIFENTSEALTTALSGSRKQYPKALRENFLTNLRLGVAAFKDEF